MLSPHVNFHGIIFTAAVYFIISIISKHINGVIRPYAAFHLLGMSSELTSSLCGCLIISNAVLKVPIKNKKEFNTTHHA